MIPDPGVVRRALQRIVEGHLDAVARRGLHQVVEVVDVAKVRVERRMTTLFRAHRPGAARIPRYGHQGVIFPFRNERPIGWTGGR